MSHGKSHWKKYGTECNQCHKTEPEVKLTRHHELNQNLMKTGKIIVLCYICHHALHHKEQKQQGENNRIVERLKDEIKATENLLSEGNPFMLSPTDYLNNLKQIEGTLTLVRSSR